MAGDGAIFVQIEKGSHCMEKGYPSKELLQRYLEAYQSEGEAGIRRVLQEQREKRSYVANLIRQSVARRKDNASTK
jgi:hypothetical protein